MRRSEAEPITVYGFFVKGRCVYVGRTKDLAKRMDQHRSRRSPFFKRYGYPPIAVILDRVPECLKCASEAQQIIRFKKIGKASLNMLPQYPPNEPLKPRKGLRKGWWKKPFARRNMSSLGAMSLTNSA